MSYGTGDPIGLVGLGIMGAPIVRRLRSKGFQVTVWNLEPERFGEVRESGATWADSPVEVWAASRICFTCVLGDDALESVTLGPNGYAYRQGAKLHVDLSTSSPDATLRLAQALRERTEADWVDAPMSGGPQAAETGALTLMLGGDESTCDALQPVFATLASNVTHMGPLGAGQKAKILNQAIVGVNYVLMAELLALARKSGIDPGLLPGCLKGGMADSTILQRIFTQMAASDFDPPRSYARQISKDLKAVKHFVDELALDLPIVAAAVERYREWAERGNGLQDGAAVSRAYE